MTKASEYILVATVKWLRDLENNDRVIPTIFDEFISSISHYYNINLESDRREFYRHLLSNTDYFAFWDDPYSGPLIVTFDGIFEEGEERIYSTMTGGFVSPLVHIGGLAALRKVFDSDQFWQDLNAEVENFVAQEDKPQDSSASSIPASDRFVDATDNLPARDEAVEILTELEKRIRLDNEAGAIFGDDRDAVAEEVGALSKIISAARIRVSSALTIARQSLVWIASKAGSASVGDLAKRALSIILDWLS